MRIHSTRKIFLFGRYSLALLPPKKWLQEIGVTDGDQAQMVFDRKKQRIILSFPGTTAAVLDRPRREKITKTTLEGEGGDWQTIPEL